MSAMVKGLHTSLPSTLMVLCPPNTQWESCVQDAAYTQHGNWSMRINHTATVPWQPHALERPAPLLPGQWHICVLSEQRFGPLSVALDVLLQREVTCASDSQCHGHGLCSPSQGTCQCFQGWGGASCTVDTSKSTASKGVTTPVDMLILYVVFALLVLFITCICFCRPSYMDKSLGSGVLPRRFSNRSKGEQVPLQPTQPQAAP